MNLLSFLLSASRGHLVLALLLGLVSGASSVRLVSMINDALAHEGPVELGRVLAFAAVVLLLIVGRSGSQVLLSRLHQRAVHDLRVRLSRQILAASLRRLELLGEHRLMTALQDDAMNISQGLNHLPNLAINAATIVGCLSYLAWMSWTVFLAMLGVLALGVSTHVLLSRHSLALMRRAREALDTLFKHFHSLTRGVKELKLHQRRREAFFGGQLEPTSAAIRDHMIRSADMAALSGGWGTLLHATLMGLLLFAFPVWAEVDRRTLIGYTLVVLYLQAPVDSVLNLFHPLMRAGVALQNMERLGLTLVKEGAPALAPPEPRTFRRLELVGVTHSYHRENEGTLFTLGPLELTLEPGEILFVVGGNGSGKTTLAKLLTGLYVPEEGEVRLDGQLITDAHRNHYRQHFATVFSDFHLFESLLGLASPELASRAQDFLLRLQLDRKVRIEDGVLSTTELSQGQRKRLALLTAYLEDRPIYVFDEWAADQDPTYKEIFYKELLPELQRAGKAVVVISHDDRYFHLGSRLIRLEFGNILPPDELSARVQRAS